MRKTVMVFVCVMLVAGVAGAQQGPGKPDPDLWDMKTYNGNFCKARHGNQAADFLWLSRGIQNISADYREISCPLFQDNFYGWGDVGSSWALSVKNEGGDFCCTLYAFDWIGGDIAGSSEVCFDEPIWTHRYVSYPEIDLSNQGYLGLYCNLPPGSTLFMYAIWEKYRTDDFN